MKVIQADFGIRQKVVALVEDSTDVVKWMTDYLMTDYLGSHVPYGLPIYLFSVTEFDTQNNLLPLNTMTYAVKNNMVVRPESGGYEND